jgi:type IV fimbrial biogenesis protein FimT
MQLSAERYLREPGFSLTELLITLCIAAILVSVAVPSFRVLAARNLQASEINSFVHLFRLARSLSISKETRHILCPSSDGESCSPSTDWSHGLILYEDSNSNEIRDPGELLQGAHRPMLETDIEIQSVRRRQVIYHGDGLPSGYTITLTFCDPDELVPPRAVIVNNMGRVMVSDTRWNGAPLSCSS